MAPSKHTSSGSCSLDILPIELRSYIFKLALDDEWEGKVPNFIKALRPAALYKEVLKYYYKNHAFELKQGNSWSFSGFSEPGLKTISKMKINLKTNVVERLNFEAALYPGYPSITPTFDLSIIPTNVENISIQLSDHEQLRDLDRYSLIPFIGQMKTWTRVTVAVPCPKEYYHLPRRAVLPIFEEGPSVTIIEMLNELLHEPAKLSTVLTLPEGLQHRGSRANVMLNEVLSRSLGGEDRSRRRIAALEQVPTVMETFFWQAEDGVTLGQESKTSEEVGPNGNPDLDLFLGEWMSELETKPWGII